MKLPLPDNFSVESVEKLRVPQLEGGGILVIIKSNKFNFIKKIEKKTACVKNRQV